MEQKEKWSERFYRRFSESEGCSIHNEENIVEATLSDIKSFISSEIELARKEERERIVKLLDWRNRTDKTLFNDGDDVVDWIDEKLKNLTNQNNE